jgi:hypothetical protein
MFGRKRNSARPAPGGTAASGGGAGFDPELEELSMLIAEAEASRASGSPDASAGQIGPDEEGDEPE